MQPADGEGGCRVKIDPARLAAANAILAAAEPGCRIEYARGFHLCWTDSRGVNQKWHWFPQSAGSDFPRIYKRVPFGGTGCVIVSELVRWVRGSPVRPLRVWRYWCGPLVGIEPHAAELAEAAGWPEDVPCVMCGKTIKPTERFDWYSSRGHKPGPGCWYGDGCKARKESA